MNNSETQAKELFEILKQNFNKGNLKLFIHNYKRKYVVASTLCSYSSSVKVIENECKMERYTSHIFGKENEGLNRDGWIFTIATLTGKHEYITWFKNRHKNYGSLIYETRWSTTPYLNINNLGILFTVPEKTLITEWVEPHLLLQNKTK